MDAKAKFKQLSTDIENLENAISLLNKLGLVKSVKTLQIELDCRLKEREILIDNCGGVIS